MSVRRLGAWLRDAEHQMNFEMNEFARSYGLTGMQMSVIDFLSRRAAAATFQVDVEREFHVQRSTASVLIKRMMARGLVTRVVATSDSRKRQLRLTSQGQKLVPIVTTYLEQQDAKILAGLSASEAVAFRLALRQVAQWGKATERKDEENGN
ncbi:MarR family winged helix-turn-helix transcriptional regulator [Levilactobacillus tujiorum]|uniref:Winged helix-turn-helix transcriptional regulator n=1 Tax=Levilactobacillus tujiorum TaxID=2912243 RepID=A0ABX1L5N0_9LACO|nr:MarR family winged helix-turn-helix transcriptional regulator [Levilactobacillus tujiorum]MCH5465357.1 MarR family winged helix-turn-helix transcriptional regulator [Levilactobacillus tujiorum]NLR12319.1 winged helix-turn-helix transcriptional regulator [Lactobacillus sp. HBUAS51387]NLR30360.1 winged helix-turn-helix transcriptional regulator [Levilactobacillus tujiorum]